MEYLIKVSEDKLFAECIKLYAGNADTYVFNFEFDESWKEFSKFAIFTKNNCSYNVYIENNRVIIPQIVLITPGKVEFGIYGNIGEEDARRISTEVIEFEIKKGAYRIGEVPTTPFCDVWETLFHKSIPMLKNGNWYLFDVKKGEYTDTGICAGGYVPVKGIDYFTDEDIEELGLKEKEDVKNKIFSTDERAEAFQDAFYSDDEYMSAKYVGMLFDDARKWAGTYYNLMYSMTGHPSGLETTTKKNLVAAINEVNAKIGDIDTALDSILALQNTLIGGDNT